MNKEQGKSDMTAGMMGKRPANITVTILSDDPPTFDMTSSNIPVKNGGREDAMVTFENGKDDDGFDVTFTVDDQTGQNYVFFQDRKDPQPGDAMRVKLVNKTGHCPDRNDEWDGFTATGMSPDRKSLYVDNPNTHMQYFGFALRFSKPNESNPSLIYDPIGDNRNGYYSGR